MKRRQRLRQIRLYLLVLDEFGRPDLRGPFKTLELRFAAAKKIRALENGHQILNLDSPFHPRIHEDDRRPTVWEPEFDDL